MAQYTNSGTFTGVKFTVDGDNGVLWDGTNLHTVESNRAVRYDNNIIGDSTARTDTDTGYPIYLKVK